jgi:hypothetical protein
LKEAVGQSSIALARATGTYRIVAEFKNPKAHWPVATRESVLTAPYSVAAALYRYQAPELHCVRRAESADRRLSPEKPMPNSARISG